MKIGVIGAGNIGGTAANLFARAGHEVALSNSRGPDSLAALARALGSNVHAMSPKEAAHFGDAVLLAIPWRLRDQLPPAESFAGKIVIDAMNAYSAFGQVLDLGESTSSEEVAKQLPGARVVKAFNTMGWKNLETGGRPTSADRLALFVAGDDSQAKEVVSKLIEGIGFAPIDTGSLRQGGRRQQPGSPIYGRPMSAGEARGILDRRS